MANGESKKEERSSSSSAAAAAAKVKELNEWLPVTASRNGKWWYSAFHNVTAMVGAGVLGLPYAMSELGWGPGVTVLVLSWVITLYTLWQMVEMHEIVPGKRFDRYHELGQHAFGKKLGIWIVVPQQLIVEVGVNIVYMITGGKSLKKFHDTVCPSSCKSIKTTYFIMIFASVHFFLSHLPNFNSVTVISLAAAIMSLSYSTIAWVASIHKGVQPGVQYTPRASTTKGTIFQFLSALGDVAFAFAGHNVVLEIQATIPSEPGKPSKKPMWRGVLFAYTVVALCYFPVSLIGYWVFGNSVEDNILLSLEKPAWLVALANLFVVVHVIGSYQVFAQPVFDMIEACLVMKMNFKPTRFLRIVTRTTYVAITMFIGMTFPFFGGLLGFFGGFAFAPTSYYLPCIIWLAICKPKRFSLSWFTNWYDQDYYPGRRKRGKDYKEGMYELPFYYPGQICAGKVTTLHLYQGAFVDIGGVYDGWVPIKRNDWYWIRHHIKVGMHVIVEILAKRDPYRFRFPIEMRFVDPNIDHLIFNRFDFPPIFHRDEDTNPDEIRRDCRRPPIPIKDPGIKVEEEPLLSNHPYVDKIWQIHVAEQMILDDMETNPDKYKDQKLTELADDDDFDEENSVEYTKAYYKKTLVPKMILKTSVKELDLEAALAERQLHNKLRKEAKERGEEYKVTKMRRNIEMDEYDFIHWRRSFEEREALIRDISCRQALGLPLEEPGRFVDASYFGKDQYDPSDPLYRYDYWGEPKNSEKSRQERMTDAHNKSIVGKGTVWYEMSYEDATKQQMQRGTVQKQFDDEEYEREYDDDEDDDDDDFDYSILGDPNASFPNPPLVNGTESSRMSDEGMFEN